MKTAFTIVAKNYIGLAKVLRKSINIHNPEVKFLIFVADEPDENYKGENGVLFAKDVVDISQTKWKEMAFKYDITEFCTAIKPFCFKYMMGIDGTESVMYFDPDIYVFNSLDCLYEKLDKHSILLVPHIVQANLNNNNDIVFLNSGIYNLGFLGLKNSNTSLDMIEWWGRKLIDNCYDDILDGTFTDQKWMNFVTSLFPIEEVYVSQHLGANMAPWNFYEREVIFEARNVYVKSRITNSKVLPVIFVHYSGFDYRNLLFGECKRNRIENVYMDFDDIQKLIALYTEKMNDEKSTMLEYLSLPYSYNSFTNGVKINKFHRRIYRSIMHRETINNPFDCNGLLYKRLLQTKMFVKDNLSEITPTSPIVGKLKYFNLIMRFVYKFLGYNRYVALLRLMKYFSKYESQIFLLDNKYLTNNIDLLNNNNQ